MQNFKKISISLVTVLALANHPSYVYAKAFWDTSGSVYSNFTRGASAVEPTTGTTYFSGGSFELRFKKSSSYVPIYNFESPGLKTDCMGMSFNAGFASFINLDQLGDQLKDAGASVAWGVMISLAYSLPALKQVFDELNKWASFLNDLMANACQFGQSLGTPMRPYVENVMGPINSTADEAKNWLSARTPEKVFQKANSEGKITEQDTKNLANVVFVSQILQQAKDGVLSSYITSLTREKIENSVPFPTPSQRDLGIKSYYLDELNLSQMSQLGVFLIMNALKQDIALTNDSLNTLEMIANPSVSQSTLTSHLTEKIAEKSAGGVKPSHISFTTFKSMGEKELLNFFFNGSDGSGSLEDIRLPMFVNVSQKMPNSQMAQYSFFYESYGDVTKNFKEYFKDYEGLAPTSAKTIAHIANTYIKGFEGQTVTSLTNPIPVMDARIYDAIKSYIVTRGKSKFGGSEVQVNGSSLIFPRDKSFEHLLNKITGYNTYLVLEDIIDAIESSIYKNNDNSVNKEYKVNKDSSIPKLEPIAKTETTNGAAKTSILDSLKENLNVFKVAFEDERNKSTDTKWIDELIKENKEIGKKNAVENFTN